MLLKKVISQPQELKNYQKLISSSLYKKIKKQAKSLKGLKVLHLNAAAKGGGVAEILESLVPLMRNVGIKAEWYAISSNEKFFNITKKIHNALQGKNIRLTESEKSFYLKINKEIAKELEKIKADILIVHDPQPLASLNFLTKSIKTVWRCHIDTTAPNQNVWNFIKRLLEKYQYFVFSLKDFVSSEISSKRVFIIPPAINPLTAKNKPISLSTAKYILNEIGVNPSKPVVAQISRFDLWKDPLGVIRAFYLAKNKIPNLQLVLMGLFIAKDDPEAKNVFKKVKRYAKGDPDVYLFSDPQKMKFSNDILVNALQTAADVIIQKSIREGFGLVVTEAMWKYKAVVGGNTGGIKIQIKNGINGFLINTTEEAAEKIVWLLNHKKLAQKMGIAAHKSVKQKFLTPRLLSDWLEVFRYII